MDTELKRAAFSASTTNVERLRFESESLLGVVSGLPRDDAGKRSASLRRVRAMLAAMSALVTAMENERR